MPIITKISEELWKKIKHDLWASTKNELQKNPKTSFSWPSITQLPYNKAYVLMVVLSWSIASVAHTLLLFQKITFLGNWLDIFPVTEPTIPMHRRKLPYSLQQLHLTGVFSPTKVKKSKPLS